MIVLGGTTEVLRARLAAAPVANQPTFVFAYGDDNGSPVLGNARGVMTGTTDVEVVGSPTDGVQRAVHSGSIYNTDTAYVTVTVEHYDGSSAYSLTKVTLPAGSTLELANGGWRVIDSYGAAPVSRPADASAFGPQSANQFLAGPLTGAPAIAAFRSIATADMAGVVLDGGNF